MSSILRAVAEKLTDEPKVISSCREGCRSGEQFPGGARASVRTTTVEISEPSTSQRRLAGATAVPFVAHHGAAAADAVRPQLVNDGTGIVHLTTRRWSRSGWRGTVSYVMPDGDAESVRPRICGLIIVAAPRRPGRLRWRRRIVVEESSRCRVRRSHKSHDVDPGGVEGADGDVRAERALCRRSGDETHVITSKRSRRFRLRRIESRQCKFGSVREYVRSRRRLSADDG